jgi:hypothetical protein
VLFNIAATYGKKWRRGHTIMGEKQACLLFVTTYLKRVTILTGEPGNMRGKGEVQRPYKNEVTGFAGRSSEGPPRIRNA